MIWDKYSSTVAMPMSSTTDAHHQTFVHYLGRGGWIHNQFSTMFSYTQ